MYSFSPFSPYKLSSQWSSCKHDTFLLTKRDRSAANRWYFEPGSILLDILFTVCCLLLTLLWYRLLFIAYKVVCNYRRNDCGEISNLWPFNWTLWAGLSCGPVYFCITPVVRGFNFVDKIPKVWPFKWQLWSSIFISLNRYNMRYKVLLTSVSVIKSAIIQIKAIEDDFL